MTASDGSDPAVETRDLRVSFARHQVLAGIDLRIEKGKVVALIGPNGSGKTTLLRCLLGLKQPDRGQVRLFGRHPDREVLSRVGYVPQKLHLDPSLVLSVREFLALRSRTTRHWFWHGRATVDARLHDTLEELGANALLDRPINGLSGGQLQRVLIAFSLLNNPDLLVLDEPTAGVDTPGEHTFYELITELHRRHGFTVILVSHDLSMVYRHADWVYALNRQICCEGPPETVMNAESLKEAYGIQVSPYQHHHHHGHPHGQEGERDAR